MFCKLLPVDSGVTAQIFRMRLSLFGDKLFHALLTHQPLLYNRFPAIGRLDLQEVDESHNLHTYRFTNHSFENPYNYGTRKVHGLTRFHAHNSGTT